MKPLETSLADILTRKSPDSTEVVDTSVVHEHRCWKELKELMDKLGPPPEEKKDKSQSQEKDQDEQTIFPQTLPKKLVEILFNTHFKKKLDKNQKKQSVSDFEIGVSALVSGKRESLRISSPVSSQKKGSPLASAQQNSSSSIQKSGHAHPEETPSSPRTHQSSQLTSSSDHPEHSLSPPQSPPQMRHEDNAAEKFKSSEEDSSPTEKPQVVRARGQSRPKGVKKMTTMTMMRRMMSMMKNTNQTD